MNTKISQDQKPKKKKGIGIWLLVAFVVIVLIGISQENTDDKKETPTVQQVQELKLPQYEIVGEDNRNEFRIINVFVQDATDETLKNLNAKLMQEKNIGQYKLAQIQYFDNKEAAQAYAQILRPNSRKKLLTPEEADKYFPHWTYKFVRDLSLEKTVELSKQVNGEWQIIEKY